MKKYIQILAYLLVFIIVSICILIPVFWFIILPKSVQNEQVLNFVQKSVKELTDADLQIEKPVLDASKTPVINFSIQNLTLTKSGKKLLIVKNTNGTISIKEILNKKITLQKLGADEIYVDTNALQDLNFKQTEQQKPSEYMFDWFNALLYINKGTVIYKTPQNVLIKILAKDIELNQSNNPKYLHFGLLVLINHNNSNLKIGFKDRNNVYIKDNKLHTDNFEFMVNRSKVYINSVISEKDYDITLSSPKFDIDNVKEFLKSDLVVAGGEQILSNFNNLRGTFNFKYKFKNGNINGSVNVDNIKFNLVPLANIPVTALNGKIIMDNNNIKIDNISGFYGSNKNNIVKMFGEVKDYTKTVKTNILIGGKATNEFAKYVSKLAGVKITLVGKSNMGVKIEYDNSGKVDIGGGFKVPKGSNILLEDSSISSTKFDRYLGTKMHVNGDNLWIERISYYISEKITRNSHIEPMVVLNGNVNLKTAQLNDMEFDIPEPLPSEFFNILVNKRLFRNGTVSGKLKYVNSQIPYLSGNMTLKDVMVVGQRFIIKNANLITNSETVHIASDGRIRRTNYKFDGDIKNEMIFPVVVKNINLNLEDIDVENIIKSFQASPQRPRQQLNRPKIATSKVSSKYFEVQEETQDKNTVTESENAPIVFTPNLLTIEKCNFFVKKGKYKNINFGNLSADLTLTPKGILEIKSNKFDFAKGYSTLKFYADLAKENASIRLGGRNIDSNLIASDILNLPKEISGKADALIELYTYKGSGLNGSIKFDIKDGSIAKLGLVQYILNMAALFRNPVVMISPSTLVDIINIPEGSFKNISGSLIINKNIAERINIKSSSPQLSAFIVGRINLINFDSSLRIYTKFSNKNKGAAGFLRKISLNALSRGVNSIIKTENEVSYYAAELSQLPELETGDSTAQVFLTVLDGDIQTTNFISSLKKIK